MGEAVKTVREIKAEIVEMGRRMYERGYVAASDGNLSARVAEDRVVVTPTGVSKGFLHPDDLVTVTMKGDVVGGGKPTSELPMHLYLYRRRPEVKAICHAHPPVATAFATAGIPLADCVLPEVVLTLGAIPLTPYATPTTEEVPRSLENVAEGYHAFLLRNHGAVTMGADVTQAYFRMETVEHFATITKHARELGGPRPLGSEAVRRLLRARERLGLTDVLPECTDCERCGTCEVTPVEPMGGAESRGAPDPTGGPARDTAPGRAPDFGNAAVLARVVHEEVLKALGLPASGSGSEAGT
jgi:L-fuculose-phosphate aldolase